MIEGTPASSTSAFDGLSPFSRTFRAILNEMWRRVSSLWKRAEGWDRAAARRIPSPLSHTELFAVDLTRDDDQAANDGTESDTKAGSNSAQAAFTYTVKTLAGVTLLTEAEPEQQRPPVGRMLSGHNLVGLAYGHLDGTFRLWSANEQLDQGPCEEEA